MSAPQTSATLIARWLQRREDIRASRSKLGLAGYAHLAAMMRDEPCTVVALQARAHLGHMAAYRFVMSLHQLQRAHIVGWEERPRVPLLPLFRFGPGVDVPPPQQRGNGRDVQRVNLPKLRLCAAIIAFETLLRAIEVPSSRVEIVSATGLNKDTVQAGLDALVDLGLAHVPLWIWRDHGGAAIAQYQLGAGRNVPPPKVSKSERQRRWRDQQTQRQAFRPLGRAMHAAIAAGAR